MGPSPIIAFIAYSQVYEWERASSCLPLFFFLIILRPSFFVCLKIIFILKINFGKNVF
jgi:hypothetical protein